MSSTKSCIRQPLIFDHGSSDGVLRREYFSPAQQRVRPLMEKALVSLGNSSRSLIKLKLDWTKKERHGKERENTTATIKTMKDVEILHENMHLLNPYTADTEKKEVPLARLCLRLKTNSKRRLFPFLPSHKANEPVTVHDRYIMKDQIGSGGFSKVFKATHYLSGKNYAVKRIQVSLLSEKDRENMKSEVSILRSLKHASIISIYDVFQTDSDYVYLVMERVKGGELFNRIVEHGTFSESNARVLCKSMLRAVKYCHDRGIVHRDLKPENILLVAKNSFEIKLCDFGSAGRCRKGEFLETFCGTMNYMAPEMVEGRQYNESVDMWSLGVILFVTIAGYNPFEDYDHDKLRRLIIDRHYSFESPEWFQISSICKEFIGAMMEIQPNARISADSALLHPWCSFST